MATTAAQKTQDEYTDSLTLNETIVRHEIKMRGWTHNQIAQQLIRWFEMFNGEFDLRLPTPCLAIDKKNSRAFGIYRFGFNQIGTRHEITLNSKHLNNRPFAEILMTLLHEMLHQWQELYGKAGKGNYHNKEFMDKALDLGIPTTNQGLDLGMVRHGKLWTLLERDGIDMNHVRTYDEDDPQKLQRINTGASKLKKWVCGCTPPTVLRISKQDVKVQCLACLNVFKRET